MVHLVAPRHNIDPNEAIDVNFTFHSTSRKEFFGEKLLHLKQPTPDDVARSTGSSFEINQLVIELELRNNSSLQVSV